jgi:NAD(P)-dependent dehydrogenase (short-subunit alcohol dehydrogenase family)
VTEASSSGPIASLAGLVAIVTGGAGHLGAEITRTMAAHGARVVIADIDGARAHVHADDLERDGAESLGIEMDVTSERSVGAAFDATIERFGGLDVLVNNAAPSSAIRRDGPVLDLSVDAWEAVLRGILGGALLCTRQAIPALVERGGGSIVNVASVHAHAADPDLTAYPVAKAGLVGFTRSVATQYGHLGIRCNSVSFGTIPTPDAPDEWKEHKRRHQLVPRSGEPADAAQVIAFLASPASSFITGTDVVSDGGMLAHLPSYADPGTRIRTLLEPDRG